MNTELIKTELDNIRESLCRISAELDGLKPIIHTPFGDYDPNAPNPVGMEPGTENPVSQIAPPPPHSDEAELIKQFIAEGRPLDAEREAWMKANPQYFTDADRANFLTWKGAVGGQIEWLQSGIGWYKNPTMGEKTIIPPGEFDPYPFVEPPGSTSAGLYAAYKAYREAGGKEQTPSE